MKAWMEMGYDVQLRIMARIQRTIDNETDPDIQDGLEAALAELMMWSNSPPILTYDEEEQ
jgi:hypothetical protein